ncbi:MAG TPA: hypothetical protein VD735_00195 [Candidatus Saccharimonadales bacterium]|nr:hypothetical protein [Candidatus Saccharimonadales bacterium]
MKAWKKLSLFALSALFVVGSLSPSAFAQQAESDNYGVDQAYFGTGGELEMTSNGYRASAGAGDTAAGSVEGVAFQGQTGSPTSTDPLLEFEVGEIDDDHGVLDSSQTVYGSTTITVRTYNGSGYNMQVTGMPPNQSVHTIPGLNSPTTSQTNVEQFGINLADNSTPNIGEGPVQIPDETFSYGVPAPDYDTPNLFKYVSGDVIAQSVTATGETRYTLSYILNINDLTPAGKYIGKLSVVVSAKF